MDDSLKELAELATTAGGEVIGDGIQKLAATDARDFRRTSNLVVANLKLAFAEHQQKVDALARRKWRFGIRDVGSWLVAGAVEVAAAATGTPSWGLLALAANQLLGAPMLTELPTRLQQLVQDAHTLNRSPVGLLFDSRP